MLDAVGVALEAVGIASEAAGVALEAVGVAAVGLLASLLPYFALVLLSDPLALLVPSH